MSPHAVQPAEQGTRAKGEALERQALLRVVAALSQYLRIPFDERLSPPSDLESVAHPADVPVPLRAALKALAAAKLKKIAAPFVVLLAPVLGEPHAVGLGADRECLASLDPEVPGPRLAFVIRLEEGRVAFFEHAS